MSQEKIKREQTSLLRWKSTLTLHSPASTRDCMRRLSSLVCYPRQIYDLGRTTRFERSGDSGYRFEIRARRYLGRGAYVVSAQAYGDITADPVSGMTTIQFTIRQGITYLLLLLVMTVCVLLSYSLILMTLLFLPLALLMSAVLVLHWFFIWQDRDALQALLIQQLLSGEETSYAEA